MRLARTAACCLLALVTVAFAVSWALSYHTTHQVYRSRWTDTGTHYHEHAYWLISNYGGLGIAWRLQHFPVGGNNPPPADQVSHKSLPASPGAAPSLQEADPLAWHWFAYDNTSTTFGITPVTNGHLFVPYWTFTLLSLLAAAFTYPRSGAPSSRRHP